MFSSCMKVALILAASWKPSQRAHFSRCCWYTFTISFQWKRSPGTGSPLEPQKLGLQHCISLLCHHSNQSQVMAAVTCPHAFTVRNWKVAPRHHQGKLSWPTCSNHWLTTWLGYCLHIYSQECSFQEHFFSAPKNWAFSPRVLFPESSTHGLLCRETRMNSHILQRLFYEEGVKANQRQLLWARKNIS